MSSYADLVQRYGDRLVARYATLQSSSEQVVSKLPPALRQPPRALRPVVDRCTAAVAAHYEVAGRVLLAQRLLLVSLASTTPADDPAKV